MSEIVIRTDCVGKRYNIGGPQVSYKTLRESLAAAAGTSIRWLQGERQSSPSTIWALEDVSFEVKRGETVGIIGRNGAGKSTLLKILSRITKPTRGTVDLFGRVGSLLEVGTGFHPELTGRENVYLNGAILGMSRKEIEGKFDEIVEFAEVRKFLDTPVKFYSSGMYVRLAFAIAAHLEPEILIVDEVLAVGDAAFQRKCLGKMGDVSKHGRTVLFVSHNVSAINRLCSRTVLLDAGHLVLDGPTAEVTTAYLMGEGNSTASRSWDIGNAPGTQEVRLLGVRLLKADGSSAAIASVQDAVTVRIDYLVGQPNTKFRCAVMLRTQGVVAFSALEPTETSQENAGQYYSTVVIPPHLLSEGEYVVGVSIFASATSRQRFVQVNDAVVCQVYDPMDEVSARGDYAQEIAGVVRPLLNWESGRTE
ncbi:MAG: ABC transporter ATP-binding protein [Anaerolineales bacterium]